jgi:hypothetical protein
MAESMKTDEEGNPIEFDEAEAQAAVAQGLERARGVFDRGYQDLKSRNLKEEVRCALAAGDTDLAQRVVLLEAWKAMEGALSTEDSQLVKVEAMMPRVVKKRRKVAEDGSMEECASFGYEAKRGFNFARRLRPHLPRRPARAEHGRPQDAGRCSCVSLRPVRICSRSGQTPGRQNNKLRRRRTQAHQKRQQKSKCRRDVSVRVACIGHNLARFATLRCRSSTR